MGYIVWRICVPLLIAVWLNVGLAQYLSSCQTPNNEAGTCVFVRECPFARGVLKKQNHTANDIRYLEAIRCGMLETKALVCCSEPNVTQTAEPVDAETIAELVENRFNTPEEKRELLPAQCGQDFYQQANPPPKLATVFQQPWNVLVQHRTKDGENRFHCGGALISDRYVLTAARCIMGVKKTWTIVSVRIGETDLGTNPDCTEPTSDRGPVCGGPVQDIAIEKIIVPSNYTGTGSATVKQDIALVRLASKVEKADFVAPICLPLDLNLRTQFDVESGQFVESGWGKTVDATGNDRKMSYESTGVSREVCRSKYPHANIDEGHICATPQHVEDTCRGDSGGPLMYRNTDGTWYLVGIASFRKECAITGEPAVFTNVGTFTDWIIDNLEP